MLAQCRHPRTGVGGSLASGLFPREALAQSDRDGFRHGFPVSRARLRPNPPASAVLMLRAITTTFWTLCLEWCARPAFARPDQTPDVTRRTIALA